MLLEILSRTNRSHNRYKNTSQVQKMHLLHTFLDYPTIKINSQDPHLLGFDSNLIPNFNILVFQLYPGEDSEYSEELGRFACTSASPLGNTPNIREIHLDWYYFFQRIQQGPLQTPKTSIICRIRKEKPEYSGNSLRLVSFFQRIQQGSLQTPKTSIICQIWKEIPE